MEELIRARREREEEIKRQQEENKRLEEENKMREQDRRVVTAGGAEMGVQMQNELVVRSNSGAPVFRIDFDRFGKDVKAQEALDQTNEGLMNQLVDDARDELERERNVDEEEVDDQHVNIINFNYIKLNMYYRVSNISNLNKY